MTNLKVENNVREREREERRGWEKKRGKKKEFSRARTLSAQFSVCFARWSIISWMSLSRRVIWRRIIPTTSAGVVGALGALHFTISCRSSPATYKHVRPRHATPERRALGYTRCTRRIRGGYILRSAVRPLSQIAAYGQTRSSARSSIFLSVTFIPRILINSDLGHWRVDASPARDSLVRERCTPLTAAIISMYTRERKRENIFVLSERIIHSKLQRLSKLQRQSASLTKAQ